MKGLGRGWKNKTQRIMARADFSRADFSRADLPDDGPHHRRTKSMPRYSVNKTTAYARGIANLFSRNQADLLTKGLDATDVITGLNEGADELPVTDEEQEHAKSDQVTASDAIKLATRDAYDLASSALKTASGLLGKTGPEADEARRIRKECSNPKNPAQVGALVTSVIAYLNNHKPALLTKKFDPTAKIAELTPLPASLTTGKGHHEEMRGGRGDATAAIDGANDVLFNLANDNLEAAMNLYPDNSAFNQEALRLRLALRGRDNGGATPPPTPPNP
jgi:hypothetical protein